MIFMRGYLAAYDLLDRAVLVADSFAGLPKPSAVDEGLDLSRDVVPILAIERRRVEELFRAYDLLDERVRFLEGWFAETLRPPILADRAAAARRRPLPRRATPCSPATTASALEVFVIVDDHGAIPQCARAVADFRAEQGITDALHTIDWTGVHWRKSVGTVARRPGASSWFPRASPRDVRVRPIRKVT